MSSSCLRVIAFEWFWAALMILPSSDFGAALLILMIFAIFFGIVEFRFKEPQATVGIVGTIFRKRLGEL